MTRPSPTEQLTTWLVVLGVILLAFTWFFHSVASLGRCWEGCPPEQDALLFVLWLVPAAYIVGSIVLVKRIRRNASVAPSGSAAARGPSGGTVFAMILTALLIATSILVTTCFALVNF